MFRTRAAAALAGVGALLTASGLVVLNAPAANATADVPLCHATDADTNPYTYQSVDASSTDYQGHLSHRNDPQQVWKKGTWWNGAWHPAGSKKPDLINVLDGPVDEVLCNLPGTHELEVTPSVTWTEPTCANDGTADWAGADTDKVAYQLTAGAVGPGNEVTVTATPKPGYVFPHQADPTFTHTFTSFEPEGCSTRVTAVGPTVVQSSECGVQGTYTIPSTTGVRYLLDGKQVAAGAHQGPASGTITAEVADDTYVLANPEFSYQLDVPAAAQCPPEVPRVTAVAPQVNPSTQCGSEGSYVIPATDGVQYYLDGAPVAAGSHAGPASGTITAAAVGDHVLTNPGFSFALDLAAAVDCPVPPTVVTPAAPQFTNPTCTDQGAATSFADTDAVDYTQTGLVAPGETVTVTAAPKPGHVFPAGFDATWSHTFPTIASLQCGEVLGTETAVPRPTKHTHAPRPHQQPTVLGTEAVAPTAVDAGLASWPRASAPQPSGSTLLGQALVGGGLLLLAAGGSLGFGRRRRGAHAA